MTLATGPVLSVRRAADGATALAGTMRAAQLVAPGRIELVDAPLPEIGPRDVLVRMEGCGLCSSSLPLWQGRPWFRYPQDAGAPGHEGWGTVWRVGSAVTRVARGDRVAIVSHHALAEYDAAGEEAVVQLPPALDGRPFPGEAFGCGFNVWSRSGIGPGQTVAVVGIGFLGAMLVQLARFAGARVVAVSRREASRRLARRLGAELDFALDEQAVPAILDATDGRGCERVVEATGHQAALDLASAVVATRGRLVIAGYHQDGRRQVDLQSWNWRGIDVVNAHERDPSVYARGIAAAAASVASGTFDDSAFVTHEFPMSRLGDAFEQTHRRPDGFVKAVVRIDAAECDA